MRTHPSVARIIQGVSEFYELEPGDILGRRKTRVIARARLVSYWLARKLTGRSYPELGDDFGRDHTTVMIGCNRIDYQRSTNLDVWTDVEFFLRSLPEVVSRAQVYTPALPESTEQHPVLMLNANGSQAVN